MLGDFKLIPYLDSDSSTTAGAMGKSFTASRSTWKYAGEIVLLCGMPRVGGRATDSFVSGGSLDALDDTLGISKRNNDSRDRCRDQ